MFCFPYITKLCALILWHTGRWRGSSRSLVCQSPPKIVGCTLILSPSVYLYVSFGVSHPPPLSFFKPVLRHQHSTFSSLEALDHPNTEHRSAQNNGISWIWITGVTVKKDSSKRNLDQPSEVSFNQISSARMWKSYIPSIFFNCISAEKVRISSRLNKSENVVKKRRKHVFKATWTVELSQPVSHGLSLFNYCCLCLICCDGSCSSNSSDTVRVCCHPSSAVGFVFRCQVATNISLCAHCVNGSTFKKTIYFPIKCCNFLFERRTLPYIYQHPGSYYYFGRLSDLCLYFPPGVKPINTTDTFSQVFGRNFRLIREFLLIVKDIKAVDRWNTDRCWALLL